MKTLLKSNFIFVVFFLALSAMLWSCEKEELPAAPATVQGQTANLGPYYKTQTYFNINTNQFVKTLEHFGYDLSVEASPQGKTIYLNSSNIMYVKNRGAVSFESVTDTNGVMPWKYDFPTGEKHRTAFGIWYNNDGSSKNEVFVLDRGYDEMGNTFGYLKLQILGVTQEAYSIRVAQLDGSNERTVSIPKNDEKIKVQFSFNDDSVKDVEPNKDDWHILFTQYTDFDLTTEGDTIPYSVRGALINNYNTSAAKTENPEFEQIFLDMMPQFSFSTKLNIIGYNWKYFSLDTGYYTVKPEITYLIKTKSGTYYKLRFLDFYNNNGEKGYPKFEVLSL